VSYLHSGVIDTHVNNSGTYLLVLNTYLLITVFFSYFAELSGAALFKDALAGLGGCGRRQLGRPHQTHPSDIRSDTLYFNLF
jgi:hypothetical protein